MYRVLSLLLFAFSVPVYAASLPEALEAYRSNKVAEAERLFGEILADKAASASDRAAAARELARIKWLIDGKADAGLKYVQAAASIGDKPCATGLLEARILREAGRLKRGIARSPGLIATCDDPSQADEIRLQTISMHMDVATATGSRDDLDRAAALIDKLAADVAAGPVGSRARLQYALLAGRAEDALRGWRDYFWLSEVDAPPIFASGSVAAAFSAALKQGAGDDEKLALASILIRVGFAEEARRYMKGSGVSGSDHPLARRLAIYFEQTDRIRAAALKVNKDLARGRRDEKMLAKVTDEATDALFVATGASGNPVQALIDHYGLFWSVGMTSGYPSLHMGHVVEDRRETVSQYGHAAKVRFLVLDNMVSNGFQSWLWDGSAATGGWSGGGNIVQIRSEYLRGPPNLAALTADSAARRDLFAQQQGRATGDAALLQKNAVASLRGLSDRLRLQVADRIDAAARARVGPNGDLRRAFLEEAWRAYIQRAITTHEGRHAINQAMAEDPSKLQSVELEYQAKLAELSLSDYPRLAFISINGGVEGTTAHDRAGAQVMRLYTDWMTAHPGEIAGYDSAAPALAQVDRLTDDQIRAIALAADPLVP